MLFFRKNCAKIQLYDTSTDVPRVGLVDTQSGISMIARPSFGTPYTETITAQFFLKNSNRTIYFLTCATDLQVLLPDDDIEVVGRLFIVSNDPASTGALTLRNESDLSSVAVIAAGESALVVYDKLGTGKFKHINFV